MTRERPLSNELRAPPRQVMLSLAGHAMTVERETGALRSTTERAGQSFHRKLTGA
jgi:hypothetical protein